MIMLGSGASDRALLDRYIDDQNPEAFQDLVSRHGAAVHRVCRQVLGDLHEAEDAFQATFLVLARRAPEIQQPELLGGWLRGVAHRIAVRSRRRAARRRETEQARAQMSPDGRNAEGPSGDRDLKELVQTELDRLPETYRRPIVLCYLDGLTHQEAARRLDWPVGTVKVRLVRGRRILRERLNRRGVALSAAFLLMLPTNRRASAVTAPLIEATVRAAVLDSAGRRAALKAEFAGAAAMAASERGLGPIRLSPWFCMALAAACLALLLFQPVARAFSQTPSSEVDPSTLPINLTNVLNVECR